MASSSSSSVLSCELASTPSFSSSDNFHHSDDDTDTVNFDPHQLVLHSVTDHCEQAVPCVSDEDIFLRPSSYRLPDDIVGSASDNEKMVDAAANTYGSMNGHLCD